MLRAQLQARCVHRAAKQSGGRVPQATAGQAGQPGRLGATCRRTSGRATAPQQIRRVDHLRRQGLRRPQLGR
eukprot:19607-Lingulodinium_polyedra.AAC.1